MTVSSFRIGHNQMYNMEMLVLTLWTHVIWEYLLILLQRYKFNYSFSISKILKRYIRSFRINMTSCHRPKEFHNSLERSIIKVYLFGNKLTVKVAICSSLHVLGTGTESSRKERLTQFPGAFILYDTLPDKMGRYLKGCWLKEFPLVLLVITTEKYS